jgi:hypothetical protein
MINNFESDGVYINENILGENHNLRKNLICSYINMMQVCGITLVCDLHRKVKMINKRKSSLLTIQLLPHFGFDH